MQTNVLQAAFVVLATGLTGSALPANAMMQGALVARPPAMVLVQDQQQQQQLQERQRQKMIQQEKAAMRRAMIKREEQKIIGTAKRYLHEYEYGREGSGTMGGYPNR